MGSGKTTLLNIQCNTHLEAGFSANSITRGLFIRNSAHGNNTISMIDTPGTDSKQEAA
jgi:GTPase Era involved in 16S rRNA processing